MQAESREALGWQALDCFYRAVLVASLDTFYIMHIIQRIVELIQ